ncbi:probable DedD protein [Hahella chejuensis KCTC 2396]|uniref:Probable DedD protein n=1 Tax=Hahella chejuensis (strain KCTC 2396) TaxID=349521 RepID=Q2SJC7_HAHCH|nr:SPOR domain-containing protein [Hahella chejuensis]ABC29247.1 probable DedD protein [Hahella chejuensis KCTC 2396]
MDGLKQRIVGAIVLVSLAVIFLPMLFDNAQQEKTSQIIIIPDKPETPNFTIEEAKAPQLSTGDANAESPTQSANAQTGDSVADEASRISGSAEEIAQEAAIAEMPQMNESKPATSVPEPAQEKVVETKPEPKPEPKPAVKKEEKPVTTVAAATPAASVKSETKEAPKDYSLDKDKSPAAWSIQIGTFKNRDSALKIRNELHGDGHPAFTQEYRSSEGENLVRVFAGPVMERSQADKLKSQVDKRYKVNSLVVLYRPGQ